MNIEKIEAMDDHQPLVKLICKLVADVMTHNDKRYLYLQDLDSPSEAHSKLHHQVDAVLTSREVEKDHGISCSPYDTLTFMSRRCREAVTEESARTLLALHHNLTVATVPSGLITTDVIAEQLEHFDHVFVVTTASLPFEEDFCQHKEGSLTYMDVVTIDEHYAIRTGYAFNPTWVARPEDLA